MTGMLRPTAARRLARRDPLPTRPHRGFAVKRNVQEWAIAARAAAFADAFARVLAEPGRPFGPIVLKRPRDRVGRPFASGDRFHGCFALDQLLARAPWLRSALPGGLAEALEDAWLSDYAEIVHVDDAPDERGVRRVVYRYLQGSPVAGASTLEVAPVRPDTCRLRAIMAFQEAGPGALPVLHTFGLAAHDHVVDAQVRATADDLGVAVLGSTLPTAGVRGGPG